jgi:thiol-disulfide isomerase/thioredoxin
MFSRMAPACRGLILGRVFVRNATILLGFAGSLSAAFSHSQAAELKSRTEPASSIVRQTLALRVLDGSEIDLNALRGRVVIVHFFATWCEPCREEFPALQRLVVRSREQPVTVIAISVAEVEMRVRRFLQSTPVNFPVLLDQDRMAAKAWDISELPSTVILDSDLQPRLAVEGDFAWDQLDPRTLVEMLGPDRASSHAQPVH